MAYKIRHKQFFLSDSRSGLLTMFGLIGLGTGLLVMVGQTHGPDAALMFRVSAGIALVGVALLVGAWVHFATGRRKWTRLLENAPIEGTVLSRRVLPGEYGGTRLELEHRVEGKAYRNSIQGKQLEGNLDRLQVGDSVKMVVDPEHPRDARVLDWIAVWHPERGCGSEGQVEGGEPRPGNNFRTNR